MKYDVGDIVRTKNNILVEVKMGDNKSRSRL